MPIPIACRSCCQPVRSLKYRVAYHGFEHEYFLIIQVHAIFIWPTDGVYTQNAPSNLDYWDKRCFTKDTIYIEELPLGLDSMSWSDSW